MTSCSTRPAPTKSAVTNDFQPQALSTDMPLFRPVNRFDNDRLFQTTKDHSAGEDSWQSDEAKKGKENAAWINARKCG